jgi:hypothetical protein
MIISLSTIKRTIVAVELLLIAPSALFMTALFVRNVQPQPLEPAHSAQRIVMWYAARPWTLWVLLMILPLVVLTIGYATLLRSWHDDVELRHTAQSIFAAIRRHLTTLILAATTLAAAGFLAIVAVHSLVD